jgi:hypothetical protein
MTWFDGIFVLLMCFGLIWFIVDVTAIREQQKRLRNRALFGPGRCFRCKRAWEDHTNTGRCTDGSGGFYVE